MMVLQRDIDQHIYQLDQMVIQWIMFGKAELSALRHLETATQTELEHWTEQILDAVSLEALFQ